MKRCPKCGAFKPPDAFGHRSGKRANQLKPHCKQCRTAMESARRYALGRKPRPPHVELTCRGCGAAFRVVPSEAGRTFCTQGCFLATVTKPRPKPRLLGNRIILGKKLCTHCATWKSEYAFHLSKDNVSTGLTSHCVTCIREAYEQRDEQARESSRVYRAERRKTAAGRAARRAYEKSHLEYMRRQKRRALARACEELRDRYVKDLISEAVGVPRSAIPQDLVDAKRAQLKLRRLIQEKSA